MATRVVRKTRPAAGSSPAAEALQALKPDAPLSVAGRKVTVREYGYFEGLEVAHRAAPFIADMHAICADGDLRYTRIRRLFGVHQEVVCAIAAQAADVDTDWVRGLKGNDAEIFMSTWFAVNSAFFVHEVVVEMREARQRAAMSSTGSTSSPVSPAPASATSTASAGSPSGS